MLLAALERAWRKDPDTRLGQLLMIIIRRNYPGIAFADEGKRLFGLEDGQLLAMLGPETDAERAYIRDEPDEARQGWKEWMETTRKSPSGSDDEVR